ncbi:sensor histidine kinase [Bifidobacterium adolescentis]|uniref:sensor histidine kinase n=1 Tax=Bifidobacterium adolescentis TaxID=1680 RepID=UPI003DA3BBEB
MRADHPKLWHPIRITIVVITVWWILFCLVLAPTDNPAAIVWTIIEIAVLLLSPFFPKSMSLLFLIMSQSGPWLIPGADVNSLPGILYTFGMLAYETNNLVALLLLAYSIGDQLFRQLVLDTSRSNPVAIIAVVSLVLMLGCGLRWNQAVAGSRAEAEQAKARLREMESRSHIAEAIHDAVTGDLSAAAFVAQRRIDALSGGDDGDGSASTDGDDGKNADERRDELDKWTQVNDYILSALTNVHRVIDELDMDVTVLEEDADGKAFSDLLKATMAGGDRRLRALGFDITSILHVAGGAPSASPSLAGIANDLLRETYANIARHAQSGSKADLSVILKPNAVEITQINQARTTETDRTQPGGHGLAYFSKQLESHGGKLETTLRDGEWTLFAYLPFRCPKPCHPLPDTPNRDWLRRSRETKGYFKGCYTDVVHPYLQGCSRHPIFPIEKGYASPCDPTDTWQSVESQGDAFFFSSVVSERQFRRNTVRPARRRGSRAAAATGCAPPSRRWSCA